MNYHTTEETHHMIDDDPITEEILVQIHQSLPQQMRMHKELKEQINSLALDEYFRVHELTGDNEKASAAYRRRYQLLISLHNSRQ